MVTALVTVSGIACVAWTAFELLQLSRIQTAAPVASRASRPAPDDRGRADARGRSPRFAAWDDRGRPIDVEDLGTR